MCYLNFHNVDPRMLKNFLEIMYNKENYRKSPLQWKSSNITIIIRGLSYIDNRYMSQKSKSMA
ncbi:hypothetical protein Hanom_Chr14g01291871 [Helianthus anomalus]